MDQNTRRLDHITDSSTIMGKRQRQKQKDLDSHDDQKLGRVRAKLKVSLNQSTFSTSLILGVV